jgi:hypothetical protein
MVIAYLELMSGARIAWIFFLLSCAGQAQWASAMTVADMIPNLHKCLTEDQAKGCAEQFAHGVSSFLSITTLTPTKVSQCKTV